MSAASGCTTTPIGCVTSGPGSCATTSTIFFARFDGPVYNGFREWHGADVVIATGWQTVHPALTLDRAHARAYVVNDHEPEFYATSAESIIAADTYRRGLHPIAGSPVAGRGAP